MKKSLAIIILLTFAMGFTACRKTIHGSGHYITETRTTLPFTGIESSGDFKIILTEDSTSFVELYGEDNILPEIKTEVSGNKLKIYYSDHKVKIDHGTITVKINNHVFDDINLQGSGKITGDNLLHSTNLNINVSGSGSIDVATENNYTKTNVSGSGKIILSGTAQSASHNISGSGKVHAFGLISDIVTVKISGSGNCEVYVNQLLDATISGSGDVIYRGNPQVTTHISGSGHVKPD